MPAVVTFTVLGPVGASVDGNIVRIPGRRERAVLSVLLAAQGAAVSADRLVDDVWGSAAGDSAPASLQVAVSRLRALLEPGRARGVTPTLLVSGSAGYALRRSPGTVDADRLVSLVTSAHEIVGRDPQHAAT
jgi:DNA-binding SARP family transcriptional activator